MSDKKKYYRVLKDNFLWVKGSVLEPSKECFDSEGNSEGYVSINDAFDVIDHIEYISTKVVENSPEWFERVYEMSKAGKMVFLTKEKAQEYAAKLFK